MAEYQYGDDLDLSIITDVQELEDFKRYLAMDNENIDNTPRKMVEQGAKMRGIPVEEYIAGNKAENQRQLRRIEARIEELKSNPK